MTIKTELFALSKNEHSAAYMHDVQRWDWRLFAASADKALEREGRQSGDDGSYNLSGQAPNITAINVKGYQNQLG